MAHSTTTIPLASDSTLYCLLYTTCSLGAEKSRISSPTLENHCKANVTDAIKLWKVGRGWADCLQNHNGFLERCDAWSLSIGTFLIVVLCNLGNNHPDGFIKQANPCAKLAVPSKHFEHTLGKNNTRVYNAYFKHPWSLNAIVYSIVFLPIIL